MNQVDTVIKYIPLKGYVTTYRFEYSFRNLEYLVCDKFGNFFILPHCKNKRTSHFKMLDSSNGYVHYHRVKYYLSMLKNRILKQTIYYGR